MNRTRTKALREEFVIANGRYPKTELRRVAERVTGDRLEGKVTDTVVGNEFRIYKRHVKRLARAGHQTVAKFSAAGMKYVRTGGIGKEGQDAN